ncbi:site-2 protease family protein [Candidatus Gracilibacteria bacterium]|nr:site-2 protease family protein [Candidatus Gracilibacteria bacterium]MCF7856705.1 site-2 protease family protein [Candidatus Gracilibacteria bacterium]MCF7896985.1 site-2 protease family protein [Candidatus Gracilibacteria bacterium]
MLLTSILAFIVIFSLLILGHEFGHFITARFFSVKVEEFGLGLPPQAKKLFRDKKKTEYTLNWLPLGGFVRMKGEDASDKKSLKDKDSFAAKKVWQRIIIVCAGVAMNLLIGFLLLTIVFSIGTTVLAPAEEVDQVLSENPKAEFVGAQPMGILVEQVLADEPAAASELKGYDFVEKVDGEIFSTAEEFQNLLKNHAGEETKLSVIRRKSKLEILVTPSADGKIGVEFSGPFTAVQLRYAFPNSVFEAGRETGRLTKLITQSVGGLFGSLLHGKLPEGIGGPVAIAKETFYRASSLLALLNFAALLSLTLAVFNILPIPALDGGRLFFLIIEGIIRKKMSLSWEARIHAAGYILLLSLLVIISWQDIFR